MKVLHTAHNMDMIHGSLGDKIIRFVLPLAVTGILQQMFNAADVAVVGRFVGTQAMAAVGSNAPLIGLLVNLFIGVSIGANVVVSHYTGQRNTEAVGRAAHTAVVTALVSGCIVCVTGELAAVPLLHLLGVPDDVFPLSLIYLRIYLGGMPVILLYNFEAALFRSQGDTRTPLICLIASGVINVVLNLFFVLALGMSADGVALATVISNLISAGLMFFILLRTDMDIRIDFRRLSPHLKDLREMLRIGLPAGVQGMVFSVSNMAVQSAVNSLGSQVMAASSAAFNVEILAYYVLNAYGQACTTFTGQNYGAGKMDRCKRTLFICILQNTVATACIAGLLFLFRRQALGLFNSDPQVILYGSVRMAFILSGEVVNGFNEIMSGSLRGYGHSLGPAMMTLIGVCGTRITWVLTIFRKFHSFSYLMACYPVSWIMTAIALIIYYRRMISRMRC